jgi:hypothetical protein
MRTWCWLLLGGVGCVGDGEDKETGTDGGAATFSQVRDDVLVPTCALSTCHAAGSANGMELVAGSEYEALVNVASIAAAGETLVVPGDSDGSYLVDKLEDADNIVGSPMPPPFGGLDPAQIQMIRDWIDAGALDN